MLRFLPVCLVCVLWLGVCAAQEPPVQAPPVQAPSVHDPPAQVPAQQPLSPASASADGVPTANGLNSLQGLKVATLRINSQVEHAEWLETLLPQKANQPLDKYKVRQSVQVLYNTGKFAEIQVEAQRTPQGEVVLTFDARENYFFGSIRVEGAPGPPTEPQLVSASKLGLGEQFTEEKIKNAIEGMQRTLQENGYFKASIQPFYEWDSHHQQVKILFVITRGSRARIGAIKVTGTPENTPDQIASIAKLRPGDHVTAGHLTRGLQRLRKRYQKKGRLEAQVTLTQRVYHPENNTLDYTFDITSGPIVEVKVEGAKIRSSVIKRYVPVFEENAVDEDLLNEGARNLRDYLQSQGFFDAEVTYTLRQLPEQNRQDVVFKVEKNGRHQLVGVLLQGNKYFSREDLRERMELQPAGGLLLHGVFSQAILAHDIHEIQVLYLDNGFLQVKVTPTVNDNYRGKKGHILVTLNIDEGPQTTIGKLTIEGNQVLSDKDIHNLISASEGQPYSDSMLINDQTEVMNAYFNRGFPQARVTYSAQPEAGDPTKIDLEYKITEGQEIFVDNVLIAGLHFTRPFIVNREMQIQTGDPLGQSGMLDSQRRLYDMGIFNEVNMAVQNPEGDSSHKSINFQLTEAKRYTFNYGGGLEVQTGQPSGTSNPQGSTGVSPRVSFDITRLNFRGLDHTITMKSRFGNLEKLGLLGYEVPRFFGSQQFALDFTAFYEQTNDVKTFTAKRLEGSVQVKENPDKATTLLYRMIYRRVSTDNLVIDPNLVPLFSQPVRVGMPEFVFLRDTRDNPIESHKGALTTFDIGVASGIFGSEASFVRIVAQNSTYYQFHKRRWVFARSTRIGIEEPFGNTSAAIEAPGPGAPPPESFIPLPERFLTGGSTSHRGFGINQAGPRDLATGFPLGGEALFINNFELRTPPLPFPFVGNNLSAVIFHDMGNAFTTPIDMVHGVLKFSQPNRSTCLNPLAQTCNFNYNSNAVGAGVRYRTPIGPVSFDFGYNLNPPAFPIGSPTQPAPPAPPVPPFSQVLRHFNFFFNIGQTF